MTLRIRFFLNRVRERLWVRPLAFCLLSIIGVFLAKAVDNMGLGEVVPKISAESVETLLSIIASSMLVISTFSVASMVSAYAAASSTATPRSFTLVVSDDSSQNALSTFIGAFIFSIVALISLQNSFYLDAGLFALFVLTVLVFILVILTFLSWVDRIARLGRLGTTIDTVEEATATAMKRPFHIQIAGKGSSPSFEANGQAIYGTAIGYVQRIDVAELQTLAEEMGIEITIAAMPGVFSAPGRALAYASGASGELSNDDVSQIAEGFVIGKDRIFDVDPRFGLIVLSEIASRALSPAVNDPGTAIVILGAFVRLFALWIEPIGENNAQVPVYGRVFVPEISLWDMFDDAFTSIARDGAGVIEVGIRLQKTFEALASIGSPELREVALHHAQLALARAENALTLPEDIKAIREAAAFINA